jgi:hypothetical protein
VRVGALVDGIKSFCDQRGLSAPAALISAHEYHEPEIDDLLYRPGLDPLQPPSLEWAINTIETSTWPLPDQLVPLLPVDDRSFACTVATQHGEEGSASEGAVVRWHLDVEHEEHQATVLDVAADAYVWSVVEELRARPEGLRRMLDEIGPAYELQYLQAEKRPRDFVIRPVRIACQNVIVGLAAFAHDSSIDGSSIVAWQTCEVPHVGTHEGDRALAALMLCDAFQSGGTMEIRFDRTTRLRAQGTSSKAGKHLDIDIEYRGHPEGQVPASLRRYGRSVGVLLGADEPGADRGAISPEQARNLFLAVTPMPAGLFRRIHEAWNLGIATPERLCFTLLSQNWREIELDFMLACSPRTGSIISGGADWYRRVERQAETQVTRAALMMGMLYRRLDTKDGAGAADGEVRVLEDDRVGVKWEVLPEIGGIRFAGLRGEALPWQDPPSGGGTVLDDGSSMVVLPRETLDEETLTAAQSLAGPDTVAVAVPADAEADPEAAAALGLSLLRCPARFGELDQAIERRLLAARISRA